MPYAEVPTRESMLRAVEAVTARGITVETVPTRKQALDRLRELIPAGASLMTGASETLRQIGFESLLASGGHPWSYLKDAIETEPDQVRRAGLRRQSVLADCFVGSVHAVAETGEMVIASASGSQLPSYVFTSPRVIWVAGAQKITPNLSGALQRVREYVLPMEDRRMKSTGAPGSFIGKLLIFEREAPYLGRRLTLVLVNEVLGF